MNMTVLLSIKSYDVRRKLWCTEFFTRDDQMNLYQMFCRLDYLKHSFRVFQSIQLTTQISKEVLLLFSSTAPIRRMLYW